MTSRTCVSDREFASIFREEWMTYAVVPSEMRQRLRMLQETQPADLFRDGRNKLQRRVRDVERRFVFFHTPPFCLSSCLLSWHMDGIHAPAAPYGSVEQLTDREPQTVSLSADVKPRRRCQNLSMLSGSRRKSKSPVTRIPSSAYHGPGTSRATIIFLKIFIGQKHKNKKIVQ